MNIKEAIERYTSNAEYERTHGNLQGCLEFKQLAEWLKELKQLREQEPFDIETYCKEHFCVMVDKDVWEKAEKALEQETYNDAISRKEVLNQIFYSTDNSGDVVLGSVLRRRIENLPSVRPQEPKTGHWEWVQYDANPEIGNFHCSECRYIPASFNMSAQKLNYCPNCGAKMESEEV